MNAQSMTRSTRTSNQPAHRVLKSFLAGLGLLVAGCVEGNGVTLLSDNRSVSVSVQAPPGHTMNPGGTRTDSPSTHFTDGHLSASGSVGWEGMNGWTPASTYGSARQDATLTPNQIGMSAVLFVSVGGDPYGVHYPAGASGAAWASSVFEVEFSVASSTAYTYMFDFDPSSTLTAARLLLVSDDQESQILSRTSGAAVTGWLNPGTYTLRYDFSSRAVGAQAGYNSSSVVFNFAPGPVPEPTAFALFGLGLIALGTLGRSNLRKAG